jgi:hypothetical protein
MSPSYLDIIVAREQYQERLWQADRERLIKSIKIQPVSRWGWYSKVIGVIEFITLWLVYS